MLRVLSVRPKIAELSFQVYGRPVHPELFKIHKSLDVKRGSYAARLDITNSGHVITWRNEFVTITEVAASMQTPLPKLRMLLQSPLIGEHTERCELQGGLVYESTFSLESYKPEALWAFQKELNKSDQPQGLLHSFDSSGRMAMGAMSYIYPELRDRSFRIQACHTFPDDCAIVKTQTTIHVPVAN